MSSLAAANYLVISPRARRRLIKKHKRKLKKLGPLIKAMRRAAAKPSSTARDGRCRAHVPSLLQLLIGGSGFLSTALVAIIATHKDKPFSQPLMLLPLLASVAAVMCGMVGAQLLFLSKQAFALRWEFIFFGHHRERREDLLKDGIAKQKWAISFFWLGFILFGVAAVLAAIFFPRQS